MQPSPIAIVGMAGRFPGARNLSAFWKNLRDGIESIRDLTEAELRANGASAEELSDPDYVKRAAILDDVPMFDAGFFGFSPRDASIMDPQHRHFLECAWEAFEDAGHPPRAFEGAIGVFAGSGLNSYLIHNLLANRKLRESAGLFQLKQTGNDKDVLATRVSYQFDLRGPSVNVQTACSTSLVAVHMACQSLLNYESDMALAGGVTIEIPHGLGYVYREGEILSRDGRCRSFDASSSGTVFASGLGIVVLRRLEDAVQDGDHIRAVIIGSAINNDGARKVGYLAPSVEGQAEVVQEALAFAGLSADEISYVETHGTGTIVGDPIEVRALTQAFRSSSSRTGYCRIGSLKSSVGHLDAAAGVSGLIKTVLSLENKQVPPSLHFQKANPHIDFARSPFYVNDKLADWPSEGAPRRAGVTSLGIGGTNAHVIVEEAPTSRGAQRKAPHELLVLSAKSANAVERAVANLGEHLRGHPEVTLADVAFTLRTGREEFAHRRAIVAGDPSDVVEQLGATAAQSIASGQAASVPPKLVFLFSGQGSQYVNMGRALYENERAFRETLDECASHLLADNGIDLLGHLYPADQEKETAIEKLSQTWLTQPALFSVEYALACWWKAYGIEPSAMIGHSIGEYVAACLAGVFSLKDALSIVALRGRLIYEQPAGAMLAVMAPAAELIISEPLSFAALNHPRQCVVSGPTAAIEKLERELNARSIGTRHLVTSHAFHSSMMDPILTGFEEKLKSIELCKPRIPYLSNVSGTWIKDEEASDPAYWARHIRQTVRFADCLAEVNRNKGQALLEVGPGNVLTSLAQQQSDESTQILQSLPHPRESATALQSALRALGTLWVSGARVAWEGKHATGRASRISLPTYPFERQKFWIEPDREPATNTTAKSHELARKDERQGSWTYRRTWRAEEPLHPAEQEEGCWIVFRDSLGLGDRLIRELTAKHQEVVAVDQGALFKQLRRSAYTIRPGVREDYDSLLAQIIKEGFAPRKVLHLWAMESADGASELETAITRSFFSPLYLAQALGMQDMSGIDIAFISNGLQRVANERVHCPERAVLFGPARVIPRELPGIRCRTLDIEADRARLAQSAAQILTEMNAPIQAETVAFRGDQRWVESFEETRLDDLSARLRLQENGVYLVTGGLGGIGLVVACSLAKEYRARLILIGRSTIPEESKWESLLKDGGLKEGELQKLRSLLELQRTSGGLLVEQGDVADVPRMREIVARAVARFGKIDGVFHAAGVLDDGPLMLKGDNSANSVLNPKVQGTLALYEALRENSLQCFVLFSSISSILPPPGQVDYAAANAFLDAFALSKGDPFTVINWGAWREVGMAARNGLHHPFLQRRLFDSSQEIAFACTLSPGKHWVLADHKLKSGRALLPGTAYLEMVSAAFQHGSVQSAVEMRDVFFLAPFACDPKESREVQVHLTREVAGESETSDFKFAVLGGSRGKQEFATGTIGPCSLRPQSWVDLHSLDQRCDMAQFRFDSARRTRQEEYLDFGPRWRCLKRIQIGAGEALAELELPADFEFDLKSFRLHPALLDLATGCSLYSLPGYASTSDLYLPISYKRVRIYESLPGQFFSHIREREGNALHGAVLSFDLTLFDRDNRVLVEIEGFTMRRVEDALNAAADEVAEERSSASEESKSTSFVPAGIAPEEGIRILNQILATESPNAIIALSGPLEVRSPSVHTSVGQQANGVDPGADVESTLVAWWQELLGVEKVELEDDFFALGGHSLVGIRLLTKIKKAYKLDLELGVLFEARTVRKLAERIREAQQPLPAESKSWSCLVPIQPNGSRIPLFCVHAIGGDVLFYEKLAKSLGPSQPFYAFRSPLVAKSARPHTSIEELASTYIKEMQAFYPGGPYLLGGLSYGGLVAFEMAQQLHAQGIEPGLLLLFDTSVPGSVQRVEATDQFLTFWQNLKDQGPSYLTRKAEVKRNYWGRILHEWSQVASCKFLRLTGQELPPDLHYFQVQETHKLALARYTFRPYPGKVTLMRAIDRGNGGMEILSKREDPALGWSGLAGGGLEIHDVPAGHSSMLLEPNVRTLAEMLKTVLPAAETTAPQVHSVA